MYILTSINRNCKCNRESITLLIFVRYCIILYSIVKVCSPQGEEYIGLLCSVFEGNSGYILNWIGNIHIIHTREIIDLFITILQLNLPAYEGITLTLRENNISNTWMGNIIYLLILSTKPILTTRGVIIIQSTGDEIDDYIVNRQLNHNI